MREERWEREREGKSCCLSFPHFLSLPTLNQTASATNQMPWRSMVEFV